MHPLGCRFGSVSGTRDMNTHALQTLIILRLLLPQSTGESSHKRSQQCNRSRNEIRRC